MSEGLAEVLGLIAGVVVFIAMLRLFAWARDVAEQEQRRERERKRMDDFFSGGGGRAT